MEASCCSCSSPLQSSSVLFIRSKQQPFSAARFKLSSSPSTVGHGRSNSISIVLRRPYVNPMTSVVTFDRGSGRRALISRRRPISAVFERFTERSIKAVVLSQREARALGKGMVFTQHLLLGLVAEDRSKVGFLGSGITIERAREAVKKIWSEGGDQVGPTGVGSATGVPFSISSKRVFENAAEFSRRIRSSFIAPEYIAIGLFTADDGSARQVLKSMGVDINHLASVAVSRIKGELTKDGRDSSKISQKMQEKSVTGITQKSSVGKSASVKSSGKAKDKSALGQFCVDLTIRAAEGLIDPVVARDIEVQRVIQILCRRSKNNPILLGEPGVGKTAIAEGLALRIANGDIPVFLLKKRIMSLDLGLVMAGSTERGEIEARVTRLISEVKKAGDVILFIDEVHTLVRSGRVGRGDKNSSLDFSNLLNPALGRGGFQEDAMLRLDMSEYMERYSVDKIIGCPPGYTGYGEGDTLTEAVRRKPFTMILLDEIEKAHTDVFNLLLQIFEDGHLTDSQGRRVSFKNTLIIMTSNVGSTSISICRQNIGFMLEDNEASSSYAAMKALVIDELKAYFRPELLNRIDEVVVFRPLEKAQMLEIVHIMLQEVKGRLLYLGIGLQASDRIMELVCEQGYGRSYAARPLRRTMTHLIEDVISEAILSAEYKPGDTVLIDVNDSGRPFASRRKSIEFDTPSTF